MRVSILDQVPITRHIPEPEAINSSLQLAVDAEQLGYHRIWFAEHHNSVSFACSAPEIVAGLALERTRRIRVGTGGILLPLYAPEKVIEVMGTLGRVHGDRVDPGFGQASFGGTDYPARVAAVADARRVALPGDSLEPEGRVWMLGSGIRSAPVAGRMGIGYVHGHFLNSGTGAVATRDYREAAERSGYRPHAILAVRAIAADTAERAAELGRATLVWRVRKDLGHDGPIPSVKRASLYRWTDEEAARAQVRSAMMFHGTPDDLRERLTALADEYGADEIMINTLTSDPADRLESYRLLAEAFGVRG